MNTRTLIQAQRLDRIKARARGNPMTAQQQISELQQQVVMIQTAALKEARNTAQALEGIRKGIDPRVIFTAAALAGISGHTTGPKREPCESNADAHARWASAVGHAAALKVQA